MPAKNGNAATVRAWVEKHPGCRLGEIGRAVGVDLKSGLISWMVRVGHLFSAGLHGNRRYYTDQAMAVAAHDDLCRECARERDIKAKAQALNSQLRRRAARHAAGARVVNSHRCVLIRLEPGQVISPNATIKVEKAPPYRWAPDPGYVGPFMTEWKALRG